mmetsp:Transcript_75135/g.223957  ORF Transcript_75135/g.223957 Transcript_75135/m.223957 type:complete len:329 (+) Transcript_75135:773-1759(+)
MQTKAHVHAASAAEAILEPRVCPVTCKYGRAVNGAKDLGKGNQGQPRHPLGLCPFLLLHPPDDEERLPIVLIWRPVILVGHPVYDLCDRVHEGIDLALQHLGCYAEVADPADADDAVDYGARDHHVDRDGLLAGHVVSDDVGPRLAKAQGKQGTKLDNGLLQYQCLQRFLLAPKKLAGDEVLEDRHHLVLAQPLCSGFRYLLVFDLVVCHLCGNERVITDGSDIPDHLLDGMNDEPVCVACEHEGPEGQQNQQKQHQQEREECLLPGEGPLVKVKLEMPRVKLAAVHQVRETPRHLRHAKILGAIQFAGDHPWDLLGQQRNTPSLPGC